MQQIKYYDFLCIIVKSTMNKPDKAELIWKDSQSVFEPFY